MFRRKPKPATVPETKYLEALAENMKQADEIRNLKRDLLAKDNQITYLMREMRQIDDIIFSISQCTGWPQIQPRVAQLVDGMTARKGAASNQINNLIESKLRDTYANPDQRALEGPK